MNIAILDFEATRKKSIAQCLSAVGYTCWSYLKKERFLGGLSTHPADILILDIKYAKQGGVELIEQSKERGIQKILLLTDDAKSDVISEILAMGIDDYLCFSLRRNELLVRVSVLARQIHEKTSPASLLSYGDFTFEYYPNTLKHAGKNIKLTAKEFDLAFLLFSHIDMPLSRAHIAEAIWKMDHNDMARTIDTHISRVRNKLNLKPQNGYLLEQIYGYGYQLSFLAKK